MKNVFIWIGVAFIIAATIIGKFTGIPVADWVELVGFTVGLVSCVVGIYSKAEKKDWKLYVSIALTIAGTALCVLAGISKVQIVSVIEAVAGIVALIVGLLPALISKKQAPINN